jgi:hypothetical protein
MAGPDQHTVPRFFLERFAKDHKLKAVSRDLVRSTRVSPKSATVEGDFYTLRDADGNPDYKVENALGRLESDAAPALVRLTAAGGFPPTPKDREVLAEFFAVQAVRGLVARGGLQEIGSRINAEVAKGPPADQIRPGLRALLGREPSDQEVQQEAARVGEAYSRVNRSLLDETKMVEIPFSLTPETTDMFLERTWFLISFPSLQLLTGDHPVAVINGGLQTAEGILIPVDPLHALAMMKGGSTDGVRTGTEENADWINTKVAEQSLKWIYHHPDHDPLSRIKIGEREPLFTGNLDIPSPVWLVKK